MIVTIKPVYEIYGKKPLDAKNISIDHFVPWSYVAHDELWNLTPTTRSINSTKVTAFQTGIPISQCYAK